MYMYMNIYMHIYAYAYIYLYIHVYVYTHTHIQVPPALRTCMKKQYDIACILTFTLTYTRTCHTNCT